MHTADFEYALPEESIAQSAVEPRDSSRLLVTSDVSDHRFSDLPELLLPGDLLVVNRTRVRAARLVGKRVGSEGIVEALLTRRVDERRWEALLRPARRLRTGVEIDFGPIAGRLLSDPERGVASIELVAEADVDDLLPAHGEVPLPPYFHGRLDDPDRYQTIFAKQVGSAAAPTAALHFTPRLVATLREHGVGF
ncbi:MAG: tRNA preQ1(34) S-adenosylmethionine ribosyltransferase-isomerase QueA, partial [Actinobacteria bacterium]